MAKRGNFRCTKCDPSFSMAARLGRHVTTMHGGKPKGSPTVTGRTTTASRLVGPFDGPARLVTAMQAWCNQLASQQAQIAVRIAALDRLMATLGGTAPASGPKAARRHRAGAGASGGVRRGGSAQKGTLRSYIEQVLYDAGKPMRVAEIAAAVRRAGFRTKNKTLANTVGITLAQMPTAKRVARGVFVAK